MKNTSIQAPAWDAFLKDIFNGNSELIATVQYLFGQALKKEALS